MNLEQEGTTPTCEDLRRRTFLQWLTYGLTALIGFLTTIPGLAFLLAPVFRREKPSWRPVGKIESFPIGATILVSFEDASSVPWSGTTSTTGAWLRRETETNFIAFSINCRHLGCPVRWVEGAKLFMCPCHGGVYYADGRVAAGPPPEPLKRYNVRVHESEVQIETSPVPLTRSEW
jgi:menaquinol-cytochrome c reductase iron-sulfur subunit